jgi:hypothetical protein
LLRGRSERPSRASTTASSKDGATVDPSQRAEPTLGLRQGERSSAERAATGAEGLLTRRPQRHAGEPLRRDKARGRVAIGASSSRSPLPQAPSGHARPTLPCGRRVLEGESCRVPRWLLLASMPRALDGPTHELGLLGCEARAKRGAGPTQRRCARGRRMACRTCLGARVALRRCRPSRGCASQDSLSGRKDAATTPRISRICRPTRRC